MLFTFPGIIGIFWFAVSSQWSVVNALTPPIAIYSPGIDLKNLSAGNPISLELQSNLSAVANQTTFLSLPASKPSNGGPPPSPWFLEIEGTPYAMRFLNFRRPIAYRDVTDIVNEAQFDIVLAIAATDPPDDNYIQSGKAWTSDSVYLTLTPIRDRLFHTVCILYLAAILKLWGLDSEYNFHEAGMELLKTTMSWPEVIGYGHIGIVGSTAEK